MDPSQAQWQGDGGEPQSLTLKIECSPDGTTLIESGQFRYEGKDRGMAVDAFSQMLDYGHEQATS